MATWAYPPLPLDQRKEEEEQSLTRELHWLLRSLQGSLTSLRDSLQECATLLAPNEPGCTLVLSSMRSESVKGFVTRVGTKIVKGDVQLRLNSLPPPRGAASTRLCLSSSPTAPELVLSQLVSARRLINDSLDVVDVSTWTGDPMNANFILGQLRLLHDHLSSARRALKGESEDSAKPWVEDSADENSFDPPLPPDLSFQLSISDAALVLHLRTLEHTSGSHTPTTTFAPEISLSGFSLRDRIFGPKHPSHDEMGEVFQWHGEEVKVVQKVRVDSQDPNLMTVMAKLTALDHEVTKWRTSLAAVMGVDETEQDLDGARRSG